ncbi:hypothetical protein [uncultured Desulfovibrio sp.]|uniref:hypothetical protein n=1 Tax=uncultured Desulfovibrio sp. TaxID=167968 RepID=UPI0026260845|nr:hypothetical protein [uncultured Desulfovibrio sp.]
MESYNKWRKMVYDVCREKFSFPYSVEKYGDTLEAGYESGRKQPQYGICSCNTKAFSEFSYPGAGALWWYRIPSTTFRTQHIYNPSLEHQNGDGLWWGNRVCTDEPTNELLVTVLIANPDFLNGDREQVIITAEGIFCLTAKNKKKFLFFDDGIDEHATFSTFRELAEPGGYERSGCDFTMKSQANNSLFCEMATVGEICIRLFRNYLSEVIPNLIELYKNNEELYEDALDEICEKYPEKA